jgi:hypothetical protein
MLARIAAAEQLAMPLNRHWRTLILFGFLAAVLSLVLALVVFPAKRTRDTDTAARGIPAQIVNPEPALGPVPSNNQKQ